MDLQTSEICKRLQAASTLLQNRGPEARGPVSATQAGIVVHMLKKGRLGAEQLALVSRAVAESGLEPKDKSNVEAEIDRLATSEQLPSCVGSAAGRSPMQNYENVADFLTETVWASLQDGSADPSQLFDHLLALGLRNPSEPTKQCIACLLMVASKGMEQALLLSRPMKTAMHKTTGQLFARHVAASLKPPPNEFITFLPRGPQELSETHPDTFKNAFALSAPVPFAWDRLAFGELRRTTKMRKTKLEAAEPFPMPGAASPSRMADPMAGFSPTQAIVTNIAQGLLPAFMQAMQGFQPPQAGCNIPLQFTPPLPAAVALEAPLAPAPLAQPSVEGRIACLRSDLQQQPQQQQQQYPQHQQHQRQSLKVEAEEEQRQPLDDRQHEESNVPLKRKLQREVSANDDNEPVAQVRPDVTAQSDSKRKLSVEKAAQVIRDAYISQKAPKSPNLPVF